MADNYFEKKDFAKAKDLYLAVISRLSVKENFSYQSEEFVEISIKLAYCFSKLGQYDSSEKGFQFSIDTQLGRTDKIWNNQLSIVRNKDEELDELQLNSLALLGMCYDYYSKHLERNSQLFEYALAYRLKALKISRVINGTKHEQTLVLENDVADLYLQIEDYDKAEAHLRRAINGAKSSNSSYLPLYYLNMASLHHHKDHLDLAQPYCKKSLKLLHKFNEISPEDKQLWQQKSENCLNGHKFY